MSSGTIAQSLAGVALFAALPPDVLDRLAGAATVEHLRAGAWLFREGDPANAMYVVNAGNIEVVAEGIIPTVVRSVGRGESIGELALLMGEPRSLSARARRASEVTRVEREDFEALLLTETSFALALTRVLGDLVRQNRAPSINRIEPPRIIGLVPLHAGAPVGPVAAELAEALRQMGRLAYPEASAPIPVESLDRLEATHDRVLLVAIRDRAYEALTSTAPPGADGPLDLYRRIVLDELLREREAALGRLRRGGLETVDLLPEAITAEVLNHYLAIRHGPER